MRLTVPLILENGEGADTACSRIQESRFCLAFLVYEEVLYLFMPVPLHSSLMMLPLAIYYCNLIVQCPEVIQIP